MSDSDSDDSAPLERVSSITHPKEYDLVPDDIDYKLKVKQKGQKSRRFIYTLKQGVALPYTTSIEGVYKQLTFTRTLSLETEGKTLEQEKEFWTIEDDTIPLNESSEAIVKVSDTDTVLFTGDISVVDLNILGTDEIGMTGGSLNSSLSLMVDGSIDTATGENEAHEFPDHDHPDTSLSSANTVGDKTKKKQTVHSNPDWLSHLTDNFRVVIISKCSQRVRDAVETDENIQNPREWREVYDHILNTLISHLEKVFGGVSVPVLRDMREVVRELSIIYPAMFHSRHQDAGQRNTGVSFKPKSKTQTLDGLAQIIIDRFRKRRAKSRECDDTEPQPQTQAKKGKRKIVYGVDSNKSGGRKPTSEAVEAISKTNSETSFEKREATFEKYRMELQYHFRNSSNRISLMCKSFFLDPQHMDNHFSWISNCSSLTDAVKENLEVQIGFLEKYLKYKDQTIEFIEKLASVDNTCEVEYDGSKLYKYISILRMGADFIDSNGACMIRLDTDGQSSTAEPHILAIKVDKTFVFEVHVEGDKLIGNLDLASAVAYVLHLAFVMNIHYPKECQTMWDIMQRKVARYGDSSGTRTNIGRAAATAKYEKYLNDLGRALTQ